MSSPLRRLSPEVAYVLAPNPGPMTLDGTNTWVLGDPELGPPVVVDPGPLEESHLTTVLEACHGRVQTVLLTHRHLDHAEAAAELADRAGCGVRAVDPAWRVGESGLADGDMLQGAGVRLEVVATAGHTSDSVCLLLTGSGPVRLLSGDTVLGRGTTVITHPDGDLADYLASLDRLAALVEEREVAQVLPGHGPVIDDPGAVLAHYRRHRQERLAQVRAALAAGAQTTADVVAQVYPEVVGTAVQTAAEQSVRSQLDYLRR